LFAAFVGAPIAIYAQGVDTIVEVPTTAHRSALIEIPTAQNPSGSSDNIIPMAGEYKSTKNVVEEQKPTCWNWAVDFGYFSEYNFRGTDLTPGTGAVFMAAEVSKWNFTAGVYGIRQVGTARADSWSMGEGGGGGGGNANSAFGSVVEFSPETTQRTFDEIDVYLNYHVPLWWFDLTVGNVGFFIHRDAVTKVDVDLLGTTLFSVPAPTVGDEQFDRLFARLSTSKIPYVVPSVTYYQTIYNDGQDGHALLGLHHFVQLPPPAPKLPFFVGPLHRNDELGGYFEGQLRGNFPVTDWLTINPYGKISYSLDDRTEPIDNPQTFHELIRGRSLSGWNVAQAGLELPIRLLHFVGTSSVPCAPPDVTVYLVPFGWYSYHISEPTVGTDRNEEWGGVKLTVTF
jgi:hypothetical protein